MIDPRINPEFRGFKCKTCGERLPSLNMSGRCNYCEFEWKDRQIQIFKDALAKIILRCSDEGVDISDIIKIDEDGNMVPR